MNELIKQELIKQIHVEFPTECITINFVDTKKDLSVSKVFYSVFPEKESIYRQINTSSSRYWTILSNKIQIRRLPKLVMIRDKFKDQVDKIEKILIDIEA